MLPSDPQDFLTGQVLLINKPLTWTSFDVVNKVRYQLKRLLNIKKIKVGHAGTLDPLATGLLIICTGKMTKQIDSFQGKPKVYEGKLLLGKTTPSFDGETEVDQEFPIDHITPELLETARKKFMGNITQLPPMYSAVKMDGIPLYKLARAGKTRELKPRPVEIVDFDLEIENLPSIGFKVDCSKGTYIRSLANDFGKAVNSGAYLTELCRTEIGEFKLENAWELPELISAIEKMRTE
jgi:tRNA pseudouridine 55 synthase